MCIQWTFLFTHFPKIFKFFFQSAVNLLVNFNVKFFSYSKIISLLKIVYCTVFLLWFQVSEAFTLGKVFYTFWVSSSFLKLSFNFLFNIAKLCQISIIFYSDSLIFFSKQYKSNFSNFFWFLYFKVAHISILEGFKRVQIVFKNKV